MENTENITSKSQDNNINNETTIIQTDIGNKDGQEKCPKCGSTDISTNIETQKLRCNFCHHEFEQQKISGMITDLNQLQGQVMGSGAQDIVADTEDIITIKCSSCGAEVVIDTSSATQARCHWCRNMLSINQQIPNGTIPDVVLPFAITKEVAKNEIEKFVNKRKFFAHPTFKKEFTTNNIMGVYFPYMIVDINAHSNLIGEGEELKRSYTRKVGDHEERYYDADLYHVEREFDIIINGLSIESNSERLNTSSKTQTNNIINSIMPFDIENCIKYNANYLKGFTSEKRDVNIDQLRETINIQSKDIARYAANKSLTKYDRGVCWSEETLEVKGQQWKSAYLPVWLYSYQQVKKNKKLLHYVAVNARTKETMGSIPIHMPKLIIVSSIVELLGIVLIMFIDFDEFNWLFALIGVVYFFIIYNKYRNKNARHTYETDTKTDVSNLRKVDNFLQTRRGLSNSMMYGSNNTNVNGSNTSKISKVFSTDIIEDITKGINIKK